jgi:hypothetical protein
LRYRAAAQRTGARRIPQELPASGRALASGVTEPNIRMQPTAPAEIVKRRG